MGIGAYQYGRKTDYVLHTFSLVVDLVDRRLDGTEVYEKEI